MSFVSIKLEEQLDPLAVNGVQDHIVSERTRLINQGRRFLMDGGNLVKINHHVFSEGIRQLVGGGRGRSFTSNAPTLDKKRV